MRRRCCSAPAGCFALAAVLRQAGCPALPYAACCPFALPGLLRCLPGWLLPDASSPSARAQNADFVLEKPENKGSGW